MSKKLIFCAGSPSYAYPFHMFGTVTYNERDLPGADLMILTGGEDINPALYDESPNGTTYWNDRRDTLEVGLFKKAISIGIPVFGTCRGLQLIHAMHGGKLIQHLGQHPISAARGTHFNDADELEHYYSGNHRIITEDGNTLVANSLHHQAVIDMENINVMKVLARSYPDFVIEAAYYPETNCLGVQFHPEMMRENSPAVAWVQDLVKEQLGLPSRTKLLQPIQAA